MARLLKPSRVRALPLMVFFSDASKRNASLKKTMSGRAAATLPDDTSK